MGSDRPPVLAAIIVLLVTAFLRLASPAQDLQKSSPEFSTSGCSATDSSDIVVAVEVTDKSGRPLTGLEASDFRLFDNNQPQKILAICAVDTEHPPAVPLDVRIIIDAVNSGPVWVAQERDGLSAFLKQNSGKLDHPTSIWILKNDGLNRIAPPSRDGVSLLAALQGAQPQLRIINRSAGVWGDVERTGQAIKLLKEMVSPESRTPGRKLVLFLSPGWPMLFNYEADQRSWIFNDIATISNGLRESCISLYTLDPSSSGANLQPSGSGGSSSTYESFLKGVRKIGDAQYPNLSLQVLSEHSGGQVIIGGNEIKAEIDSALRGASPWYNLVFERAPGGRATEYHAIRVTVDKPRARIRTTAGYYVKGP